MKKSTLIIIIVVILFLVAGYIMTRDKPDKTAGNGITNSTATPSGTGSSLPSQPPASGTDTTTTPATTDLNSAAAEVDALVDAIDTSGLADDSLSDLG